MPKLNKGHWIVIASILTSAALAAAKISIGLAAGSTSVVADGFESASDVLASGVALAGLLVAVKPPDADHPYGHGRFETLTSLVIGLFLFTTGLLISIRSLQNVGAIHPPPKSYAMWPLLASIVVKAALATFKFREGRRSRSDSLIADAWNDSVDMLSGSVAIVALSLTLWAPSRFLAADHYGGFAVGLIVMLLGVNVIRTGTLHITDTMPGADMMKNLRVVAYTVPGTLGVEKCYARKTGLRYHVDLHLEVDPELTVRQSHLIAHQVKQRVLKELDWVADVLVHVEPHGVTYTEPMPDPYEPAGAPPPGKPDR